MENYILKNKEKISFLLLCLSYMICYLRLNNIKIGEGIVFFSPFIFVLINLIYIRHINKRDVVIIFLVLLMPLMLNFKYYFSGEKLIRYFQYVYRIIFNFFIPYFIIKNYSKINLRKIIKMYLLFIDFNTVLIILQSIMIFLQIKHNFWWQHASRPSGIFGEPAHALGFYVPYIYYLINKKKIDLKKILLIIFSLILSKSSSNYILVFFIMLTLFFKFSLKKRIVFMTTILFISFSLSKVLDLSRINSSLKFSDSSSIIRVKKPIRIIKNIENKFLGMGIDNQEKILEYSKKTNYEKDWRYREKDSFLNGIATEFLFFGMIGSLILFLMYYNLFLNIDKYILIIFFIIRLSDSWSYKSLIFTIWILVLNAIKNLKRKNYE